MAATQIFQRKPIADAGAPAYITQVDAMIQKGHGLKDRGARLKLFDDAHAALVGAIGTKKKTLADCLALAEVNWELTKPNDSIEFLKEAIQLSPKDARPYALLGRYLLNKGLKDQAMNFLDRAIQLDPTDGGTRRLRDRAALQQKKNYTVVVNAKDIVDPAANPKAGKVAQKKAEATRLLNLNDLKGAAEALEEAKSGVDNEIDRALAALVGADVLGADVAILQPDAAATRGGGFVRTIFAFFLVVAVGLASGMVFRHFKPARVEGKNAAVAEKVLSDQTTKLFMAVDEAEEKGGDALVWAFLAHTLLYAEHGASESHKEAAQALLDTLEAKALKLSPALLARTILTSLPGAPSDGDLDKDLSTASKKEENKKDSLLLMARAARAETLGANEAASTLLHQAALSQNAPPRAMMRLAVSYARAKQYAPAATYLERLLKTNRDHPHARAASVVVAHLAGAENEAANDDEEEEGEEDDGGKKKKKKKKSKKKKKKKSKKKMKPTAVETATLAWAMGEEEDFDPPDALDAAPAALVLAAFAQARGEETQRDQLLTLAEGSEESGPVVEKPGLLGALASLKILDFDATGSADLLEQQEELVGSDIGLLRSRTRASVLSKLSENAGQFTKLKTSAADPEVGADTLYFKGGRVHLDPTKLPVPLVPSFDARFFPEAAIQVALDLQGVGIKVAADKLSIVASLKLAQIALSQGNAREARDYLDEVRSDADDDEEFLLTDALVWTALGKTAKARKSIRQAVQYASDDPRVAVSAARIQLAAGDENAALKAVRALEDSDFISPAALSVKARILVKRKDFKGARAAIEKGRALSSNDMDLLAAALAVECGEGNEDAAERAAGQMISVAEDQARALAATDPLVGAFVYGVLGQRGRSSASIRALTDVAAGNPKLAAPRYFLGKLLSDDDDSRAEGIKTLEKAAVSVGCGAQGAAKTLQKMGEPLPDGVVIQDADAPKKVERGGKKRKSSKSRKKRRRRGRRRGR